MACLLLGLNTWTHVVSDPYEQVVLEYTAFIFTYKQLAAIEYETY